MNWTQIFDDVSNVKSSMVGRFQSHVGEQFCNSRDIVSHVVVVHSDLLWQWKVHVSNSYRTDQVHEMIQHVSHPPMVMLPKVDQGNWKVDKANDSPVRCAQFSSHQCSPILRRWIDSSGKLCVTHFRPHFLHNILSQDYLRRRGFFKVCQKYLQYISICSACFNLERY